MLALWSSNTLRMASMTWRGFWLVAALSRYATGLPCTLRESTGKSARMRATSRGLVAAGRTVTAIAMPSPHRALRARSRSLGLELGGELAPAGANDAPIHKDVHEVRGHIAEHPLVVRDQQDPHLGCAQRLDAA